MDIPATTEHVRAEIERPLTPDEVRVIPEWLNRAWRILQREVPGIPARVALVESDAAYLSADDVRDVLVAMVERKVRNPEGLRDWSTDDYKQTTDTELSSGRIYVTEAEKSALAPRTIVAGGGAFYSIPLSRL